MPADTIEATKTSLTETLKFDYFICGVVGAIIAYIIKDYSPKELGFNSSSIETVALLVLAASFYAGMRRIEHINQDLRVNKIQIEMAAYYKVAMKDYESGCKVAEIGGSLEPMNRAKSEVHEISARQIALSKESDRLSEQAGTCYKFRQWLLITGFLAIFAAKVWQPYEVRAAASPTAAVMPTNAPPTLITATAYQSTKFKTLTPPKQNKLELSSPPPVTGTNGSKIPN